MNSLLCARSLVQIGKRFDKVEVIGAPFYVRILTGAKKRFQHVVCRCDCGHVFTASVQNLKRQHYKSCGCEKRNNIGNAVRKHGLTGTKLYSIWAGIKRRCFNEHENSYKDYGARGISVCEEWRDNPAAFVLWAMTNGYQDGLEIDRINNDGNYDPINCRFVSKKQNTRNRRTTRHLTAMGRTQSMSAWCEELGVKSHFIATRLRRGWSEEEAIVTPF